MNFFLLLGLSATLSSPPPACYSISFNNRGATGRNLHFITRPSRATFIIGSLWGRLRFTCPVPGIIIRGIGGVSELVSIPSPVPTLYTCNAERVEKLERNWREEEEKVSGGKCLRNLTFTTRPVISIRASATECNQPLFVSPLFYSSFPFFLPPPLVLSITPGIKLVSSNL